MRDGARVTLLVAPGLFRLDFRLVQDTYGLSLRNLAGVEPSQHVASIAERQISGAFGEPLRENEFHFAWDSLQAEVFVLLRIAAWQGQLELPVVALGFVRQEGV